MAGIKYHVLNLRDGLFGLLVNALCRAPDVLIILSAMAVLFCGLVAWLIWTLRDF